MRYPQFLRTNDTIGICAPSQGVGHKLEDFNRSVALLKSNGWQIKETPSTRNNNVRSADAKTRAEELNSLYADDSVNFVMAAAGGDFLFEILPYVDFETMQKHPKFLLGASDPTGILYPYTTLCDVATIYGCNGGSYDVEPLPDYLEDNLKLLRGEMIPQHSSKMHLSKPPFLAESLEYDAETVWYSNKEEIHETGRCIGGCIDVLKDLIGTKFDGTHAFMERYQNDGFIWYFDNFSLSAEMFYRTLLQMKYAGWFEHAKAVLVGRVCFPSSETGMSYEEAVRNALGDIPVIWEADIGHTNPSMTMINGALLTLDYKDGAGTLQFTLE